MASWPLCSKSEAARLVGKLGGKARARDRSEAELSAIGKKAAEARMVKLTPEERSAIARKAVAARIRKYGQQKRKKGDGQK